MENRARGVPFPIFCVPVIASFSAIKKPRHDQKSALLWFLERYIYLSNVVSQESLDGLPTAKE
jgi:hypothetical protein